MGSQEVMEHEIRQVTDLICGEDDVKRLLFFSFFKTLMDNVGKATLILAFLTHKKGIDRL